MGMMRSPVVAAAALAVVTLASAAGAQSAPPPPAPPPGYAPAPQAAPPPGAPPGYAPAPPPPGYPAPAYGAPPGYAPPAGYYAPPGAYAPPPGYEPPPPVASPRTHHGLYFRVGLGGGGGAWSGTVDTPAGPIDEKGSGNGASFHIALAGNLTDGLALGGAYFFQQMNKPKLEVAGTSYDANNNANLGLVGLFADWFPDAKGGFHVGGLIGPAVMTVSNPSNGSTETSARGMGAGVMTGYDFWVSPTWSLGVLAHFFGGSVSSGSEPMKETDKISAFAISFTALDY